VQAHALERSHARVPPEDRVVVARRAELLGTLEGIHGGAERLVRHRLGVHRATRELRVRQPLVDDAGVVRALVGIGDPLEHRARPPRELGGRRPELVGDREHEHHEHRLIRGIHLEDVEADALGRPRLIEEPVALGFLNGAGDGLAGDGFETWHVRPSTEMIGLLVPLGGGWGVGGEVTGLGMRGRPEVVQSPPTPHSPPAVHELRFPLTSRTSAFNGSKCWSTTRSFSGMIALSVIVMCSGHTVVQHFVMLQ
jgi:hypothetical protein